MSLNRSKMMLTMHVDGKMIAAGAGLCPDRQLCGLAGELNERPEIGRNIWRRKPIRPFHIASGIEFPFIDDEIDKETSDAINQHGNDTELRNNRRATKGTNGRFAQDGKVFFERAIGAFGSGAQGKQLAIAFSAARDFENEARMLSNRNMSGIAG